MYVIVSGGGLDSTALTILTTARHEDVVIAHVDYGQLSSKQEIDAIESTMRLLDLPSSQLNYLFNAEISRANPHSLLFGTGTEPIVRGRNLQILNTVAISVIDRYGSDEPFNLMLGLCDEAGRFPDARPAFVNAVNTIMHTSYGRTKSNKPLINVTAPFINTLKLDFMVQAYKCACLFMLSEQAYDLLWNESFTCWTPRNGKACGECRHCTKRLDLLEKFDKKIGRR